MPADPRRRGLALVPILLLGACAKGDPKAPDAAGGPHHPNVLVVCIDTLRADHLGCYGHDQDTSPCLDQLARQGVRFAAAFSASSWTKPSVPSLFTAMFPSEHQVLEGSTRDAQGNVTADILAEEWTTLAEALAGAGYRTAGLVDNAHLRAAVGMAQGFSEYHQERRPAAVINQEFLDWLDQGDGPFFAYLHYLDVHWPYRPAEEYQALFPAPPADLDLSGPTAGSLRDAINDGEITPSANDLAHMKALYDASIRQTDAALGALFQDLSERGLWDDTVVVVTSDHGEEFFEHGKVGHGHSLRDSLLHVPLLVRGPGLATDRVIDTPVQLTDVMPSVLAAAGVAAGEPTSGKNLLEWLRPEAPAEPGTEPAVFAEVLHGSLYQRSVRLGAFKLIESYRALTTPAAALPDTEEVLLRPGLRVEVKGRFDEDEFEAGDLQVEDTPDEDAEVRGPFSEHQPGRRRFLIGEIDVRYGAGVKPRRHSDDAPLSFADLPEYAILDVDGDLKRPGVIEADKIVWRDDKEGDKIKLEGLIESVNPEKRQIHLLGIQVEFADSVAIPGFASRPAREPRPDEDGLQDPTRFERSVTLYHLTRDPAETVDVAGEQEAVVERLARLLSAWYRSHRRLDGAPGAAVLDEDALNELREIGYVR